MSKEFAMLIASRKLENYLSREYYGLSKMVENERVQQSFFETKVARYNELVNTLNDLFSSLTGTNEPLFTRYPVVSAEQAEPAYAPMYGPIPDGIEAAVMSSQEQSEHLLAVAATAVADQRAQPEPVVEDVPDTLGMQDAGSTVEAVPLWQAEGYTSYEEWLADKELASAETPDDLSVGVNVSLSQHRASQVLREYEETSEHDIATFVPEEDVPVSVLPQEIAMRPTQDLRYLSHTVDNIPVDRDPTQIAGVQTAVERDGEQGRKGTDIDVQQFMYRPNDTVVGNLIDADILKLHVAPKPVEPAAMSAE